MVLTRKTGTNGDKTCDSAILSTTNPTCVDLKKSVITKGK